MESKKPEDRDLSLIEESFALEATLNKKREEFLKILCQLDEHKSYEDEGYTSLSSFLQGKLKMSKGEAHQIVTAVRAMRKKTH